MSMFIVHQATDHTLLLADSLARRRMSATLETFSASASKLADLGRGVFAAHAGTWQPALSMLSDVATLLATPRGRSISHKNLCSTLSVIGRKRFTEFQSKWKGFDIDVRVALILTGKLRDPIDIKSHLSSTVLLWEAARDFIPHRARGQICFAGSPLLSRFATDLLAHEALKDLLASTPLAAAQALLAAHSATAKLSDNISEEPNLIVIGSDQKSCVLRGSLFSLPCAALLGG
jgi:hypothetical protein